MFLKTFKFEVVFLRFRSCCLFFLRRQDKLACILRKPYKTVILLYILLYQEGKQTFFLGFTTASVDSIISTMVSLSVTLVIHLLFKFHVSDAVREE